MRVSVFSQLWQCFHSAVRVVNSRKKTGGVLLRCWDGDTSEEEEERRADEESELVNYGPSVKSGQMSRNDSSCLVGARLSVPDGQSHWSNCLEVRRMCPATSFFLLVGLQGSAVVAAAISWKKAEDAAAAPGSGFRPWQMLNLPRFSSLRPFFSLAAGRETSLCGRFLEGWEGHPGTSVTGFLTLLAAQNNQMAPGSTVNLCTQSQSTAQVV